jgi:hypothetical protein
MATLSRNCIAISAQARWFLVRTLHLDRFIAFFDAEMGDLGGRLAFAKRASAAH